jgi:hypothetical protein
MFQHLDDYATLTSNQMLDILICTQGIPTVASFSFTYYNNVYDISKKSLFWVTYTWFCLSKHIVVNARTKVVGVTFEIVTYNPLTPELNPSAQRCLMGFFTGDFASWTVHFVNVRVCMKNQQMQQLFVQFISNVW